MITKWLLPVSFVVIGILILTGTLLEQLPPETGLRTIMGVVVILLGVHRFVASRTQSRGDQRRFGGEHRRPWES